MKRTMTTLCLAAAASWVVTVGAQSGTQGGSQTGSQSGSSHGQMEHSAKKGKTTMTGCLVADPDGKGYRLTNVSMTGPESGMSGGTSGSGTTGSGSGTATGSGSGSQSGQAGTSGTMSADMTVELLATQGVNLKSHVGERVEVTGTMDQGKDKMKKGTSGSGGGSTGSGTTGSGTTGSGTTGSGSGSMGGHSSMSDADMSHRVRVQTIRTVSATCTGTER